MKELADIQNDKDKSGVMAEPVDPSSFTHLKGTFPGPPDTPYAGGQYQVDIVIPDTYPFKSPTIRFDTKIWHPNVSSVTVSPRVPPFPCCALALSTRGTAMSCTDTGMENCQGAICLDILGNGWSPVGTIKMALISVRMLLESPNPKDPQDAEVARMMLEDHKAFVLKAHEWAVKYAGAPRKELALEQFEDKQAAEATKKEVDPSRYETYPPNPPFIILPLVILPYSLSLDADVLYHRI
jgi:ubiquitin-conjugating enzyme (huntingtin interacting protein 2)